MNSDRFTSPQYLTFIFSGTKLMNDSLNFDFETIDICTRQQADQVCISELFPKVKQIFDIPVYFTNGVWQLCHNYPYTEKLILDICHNALLCAHQDPNGSLIAFDISIVDESKVFKTFTIWGSVGANDLDDPNPALTLMFPEEH